MGSRLLTQFGMIGAALFIVFALIAPKLEDIKAVEDQAAQFQTAVNNASAYNDALSQLINQKNSISASQMERLEWFMPDAIDEIRVLADIQYIAELSGLEVIGLSAGAAEDGDGSGETPSFEYDEQGEPLPQSGPSLIPNDFTMSASGPYFNIKQFLGYVEFNDYPLEVVSVTFGEEGGSSDSEEEVVDPNAEPEFEFSITLRTYTFN